MHPSVKPSNYILFVHFLSYAYTLKQYPAVNAKWFYLFPYLTAHSTISLSLLDITVQNILSSPQHKDLTVYDIWFACFPHNIQ